MKNTILNQILLLIYFCFSCDIIFASNQVANIYNREKISLNGTWQIIIDQFDYYSGNRTRGISRNYKAQNKSERVEYGFSNANTLQVPGDWNTQLEKLFFYEGSIWYKRDFEFKKKENVKVYIYFAAVNYKADVYLNGKLLGSHEGGFTPFQFECTDQLLDNTNVLTVRVNNARHQERVPAMDFDWWNYGGITRDVFLVELPEVYIEDYFIQLKKNNSDTIEGWIKINGKVIPDDVRISIEELNINNVLSTNGKDIVHFSINANPILWSPDNPKTYDISISSGKDIIKDKIGFRKIGIKGTKIFLNDKEIFLRGICIHEESLFNGGRITNSEQSKSLFNYVRELNCNFVRLAHYPHSEETLRLADELGLLIWAEVPVWQNIDFTSERSTGSAKQQLKEMIIRDKNRASIILWSVSNETDPDKKGRLEFLKSMIDLTRQLDSTRLVTTALHKQIVNDSTLRFNDPIGEFLDVLAVNEYIGWYQGLPKDCKRFKWETIYNKPHIISEFGGEAVLGFRADSLTMWTEDFQASIFKNQIDMFEKIPFLSGISPWILKDFRSPRRLNPDYQKYWNNKGLISNDGHRKLSFYIMQDYYRKKSELNK